MLRSDVFFHYSLCILFTGKNSGKNRSSRATKPKRMKIADKMSASQPRDRGFEPHTGHDHDSSYDTSTSLFHEANSRII